jgi:hypothetical protein
MKIGNQTDFWGGIMFAVVGFAFAIIAHGLKIGDMTLLPGYSMGTPARMGPAFFPFWLGSILTVLGLAIAFTALKGPTKPLEKFHYAAVGWVLGAVCVFGFLMKPIGMPLAGVALVIVSSFGSHDFKWKHVLWLSLGLVAFCTLVFVYGLKLPIPLCPDLETLQELRICRV